MKRTWAIAGGVVAGLLLAGLAGPAVVALAPARVKGSALLLAVGGLIVAVTTLAAWRAASRGR